MDFDKFSIKEELKNELKETTQNQIKSEDLEFDESIDDKFTSSVFNKYKNGVVQNKWFIVSGALSIVFGILCVIVMSVVGIVFATSTQYIDELASGEDYQAQKNKILICCIIFPIIGIISILVGIKILSFSKYSKEKLIEKVGEIIGFSFLQFIFSALIIVIFTIIGYFTGVGSDYGAIYYNRIDRGETSKRLSDARILYENQLIDEKEYRRIKEEILNDDYVNKI